MKSLKFVNFTKDTRSTYSAHFELILQPHEKEIHSLNSGDRNDKRKGTLFFLTYAVEKRKC